MCCIIMIIGGERIGDVRYASRHDGRRSKMRDMSAFRSERLACESALRQNSHFDGTGGRGRVGGGPGQGGKLAIGILRFVDED